MSSTIDKVKSIIFLLLVIGCGFAMGWILCEKNHPDRKNVFVASTGGENCSCKFKDWQGKPLHYIEDEIDVSPHDCDSPSTCSFGDTLYFTGFKDPSTIDVCYEVAKKVYDCGKPKEEFVPPYKEE